MVNAGNLVLAAALPVVQVVLMCASGALAKCKGILTSQGTSSLSKLIYYIFLPALIFDALGKSVTGTRLLSWWALPVNVSLNVGVGATLGYLIGPLVGTPPHLKMHFVCCASVGNLGNLPIILVPAVAAQTIAFTENDTIAGSAYAICGLFAICIATFGLAPTLLTPASHSQAIDKSSRGEIGNQLDASKRDAPAGTDSLLRGSLKASEQERRIDGGSQDNSQGEIVVDVIGNSCDSGADGDTVDLPREPECPHDEENGYAASCSPHLPAPATHCNGVLDATPEAGGDDSSPPLSTGTDVYVVSVAPDSVAGAGDVKAPVTRTAAQYKMKPWQRALLSVLFNAPTTAVAIALFVALIPALRSLFFQPGSNASTPAAVDPADRPALSVITDALSSLGGAMIPCLMVTLGAALLQGPGHGAVPWRVTAALAAIRLGILPAIGTGLVIGSKAIGAWEAPSGPPGQQGMFEFVLLLQHALPTALNMHTVAAMKDSYAEEVATMLFYQYMLSVFTIPVWVGLFLGLTT